MKKLMTIAIAFFVISSAQVFAGGADGAGFEPKPYAGISLGSNSFDDGTGLADDSDTGFKIFGGLNLNKNFAVEAGYANLGEYTETLTGLNATLDTSAFYLAAVGKMPINDKITLQGKLGFASWDLDVNVPGFGGGSADGVDPMFGIGAAIKINDKASVVVDFTRFDLDGVDMDSFSVGIQFSLYK